MSCVDDVHNGITRPRREVVVSPLATLEYFEIAETLMLRLLSSLKLLYGLIGEIRENNLLFILLKR